MTNRGPTREPDRSASLKSAIAEARSTGDAASFMPFGGGVREKTDHALPARYSRTREDMGLTITGR